MPLLKEQLKNGFLGLTVYSPDCTYSRLWGNLDHTIHHTTGLRIVCRQWLNHDINSILRFYHEPDMPPPKPQDPAAALSKYDNIPFDQLQYGHLVVKMLLQGPSLVTLWQGDGAIPALLNLKGKTQPAAAGTGTIRGGFWCDNGVCNLMHSSDDAAEVMRELTAIHLDHWLNEKAKSIPLMPPRSAPHNHIAHSGILTVYRIAQRLITAAGSSPPTVTLPPSGDATETNHILTQSLQTTAEQHPQTAPFIHAFLAGELITVSNMTQTLPATRWEQFVAQCGAVNRDVWLH